MLQQKIGLKLAVIAGLLLALLIPLWMIEGLINERAQLEQSVQADIARSSSGEQQVIGPFIYAEFEQLEEHNEKDVLVTKKFAFLPNELTINSTLDPFEKYRGIYKAQLYRSTNALEGDFNLAPIAAQFKGKTLTKLNLVLLVKDIRGIGLATDIVVDSQKLPLHAGSGFNGFSEGIHVELDPAALTQRERINYKINLSLQGMQHISFSPVGEASRLTMKSSWPHPSFTGDYLPESSNISELGFSADWQVSYFATNMMEIFDDCFYVNDCNALYQRSMGVNLVDAVNSYLKSHRAINYAHMIIVLIFAAFFLLEVFRAKPIHPIQYGFVGIALAIFYLLLISMSEHLGFNIAYLISSLAAIAVLSAYVSGVLQSNRAALLFGICISVLYGLLYGLLSAEDYALLMGSLLCFMVLSLVMLVTRNVNWYGHTQGAAKLDKSAEQ